MTVIDALVTTTMDQNNPASIWDSNKGTLRAHYRGSGSIPRHCASISGGYLYASERGKPLIHCWALNKQHCESRRLIAPGKIECFDFSPDNTHVAVAVSDKLHLYQTSSGKQLGLAAKHFQPISVVKFNSSGCLVACGGEDGMVSVWTLANIIDGTEPLFSSMDHNLPISDLGFTSGTLRARIITISADFSCKIFDLSTGKLLLSIGFPSRPTSLALLPNESAIFIGNSDGGIFETKLHAEARKVTEYHQQSDEKDSIFAGHEKQVSCLACSRDSIYLISGSHDETIKVWHIESHQCVRTILQKGAVTNLMFKVFSSLNFSPNFKPQSIAYTFINPANEDVRHDGGFDIVTSDDQLLNEDKLRFSRVTSNVISAYTAKPSVPNSATDQEAHLKLELNQLKNVNDRMYRFAIRAVLNGPSGVAHDGIIPLRKTPKRVPRKKKEKSDAFKALLKKEKVKEKKKLKKLSKQKNQQVTQR